MIATAIIKNKILFIFIPKAVGLADELADLEINAREQGGDIIHAARPFGISCKYKYLHGLMQINSH